MTYADMFAEVKGMFMEADVSDITEHLAYQFNITGEAEGIFYVEVKEGKLYVEPYEYFDRDAMFIDEDSSREAGSDPGGNPWKTESRRKYRESFKTETVY